MKTWLPLILFCLIFLLLANWHIFISTVTGLQKPTSPFQKVDNQELTELIRQKTDVTITDFYIVNSESIFAGMTGIPTHPIMTISKKMYESFSKEELSYVVLHETGHYVSGHSTKEAVIQLVVIATAFLFFKSLVLRPQLAISGAIFSSIILGLLMIQLMHRFEWEADTFALLHLDDPQSMVLATQKLQVAWEGPSDNSIFRTLFYRGIPYSARIEHANGY